jgi:hypothetical protein
MVFSSKAAFVLLGVMLVWGSASAVERKNPVPKAPTTKTIKTLTVQECTNLGGTVNNETLGLCNSGKFCGTTDQNGKKHRVCITK